MAAKWDARYSHPIPHDNAYYAKCMLGGVLSCGITHTVITPLDVVKCNMQVDPGRFKSLPQGIGLIAKTEGKVLITERAFFYLFDEETTNIFMY